MDPKIVYSKRKTIGISVTEKGEVILRVPKGVCLVDAKKYLLKNRDWIIKKQKLASELQKKLYALDFDPSKVEEYKKTASSLFSAKTEEYSKKLGIKYKKFRLSNAKKRWGTCNSSKTIAINWKLLFAPEHLKEYVIVHELAHIRHMNHSKAFWKFVEKFIPDYKAKRKELKEYEHLLQL